MAYLKQLHSPEGPAVCESSCFKFVFVELNLLKFIISSYSEFSSLRKLHYKHVNIRSTFKGTVGVFTSEFSFVKWIVRLTLLLIHRNVYNCLFCVHWNETSLIHVSHKNLSAFCQLHWLNRSLKQVHCSFEMYNVR